MNENRLFHWARSLQSRSQMPIDMTVTRNRKSVVSIRRLPKQIKLRVNQELATAPESVLTDLSHAVLHNDASAWERVCTYVQTIEPPAPRPSRISIHSAGAVYDLKRILDELNQEWFNGELNTRISWGRQSSNQRRARKSRSIRFGSWDEEQDLIRVHPILDDSDIPETFVRYIVYHELCHAAAPPVTLPSGRRSIHHAGFNKLESRWPDLDAMDALAGKILHKRK